MHDGEDDTTQPKGVNNYGFNEANPWCIWAPIEMISGGVPHPHSDQSICFKDPVLFLTNVIALRIRGNLEVGISKRYENLYTYSRSNGWRSPTREELRRLMNEFLGRDMLG